MSQASEWDDLTAYMRAEEVRVLASLEAGPVHVGGVDWSGDYEAMRRRGYAHRMRAHPRCGHDENPPAWYSLTIEGRARLSELRTVARDGEATGQEG